MADIELKSFQALVGAMAARLKATTGATDLNPGSNLLQLIEAAAAADFQAEAKLIQLMQLRNLDKTSGIDLENLAFEMGLNPTRIGATPTKVFLTISESAFSKIYSNIYAGGSAPVAGDTSLKIVNGSSFSASGSIYIGRGTKTSEAVNYTSVTNNGSFWTVQLAAPLTKDHLVGEEVVMAQGGKRTISAGTVVFIEGTGLSPSIEFTIQTNHDLEDGEDSISNVLAIANVPGTSGRVGRKKIKLFKNPPWSTAEVENPQAAYGGTDIETDTDLRQRIKDHVHTLSAGTERAVIRAVIGVLDDEENKRVVSAYLRKPIVSGDPTILFIDDGTGFQPSFAGIGQEIIVNSAIGTEKFFQLQKWPLVKAQVSSVGIEPFNLSGGESFNVEVDGAFEERAIDGSGFRSPGVVTAQEIAEAINADFRTIEARAKDGQLFITPTADNPDYIRVASASLGSDANSVIRFPVVRQYTLRLYKNDVLLEKNGAEAVIQTLRNDAWTGLLNPATIGSPESLQLSIDNIESPTITFTDLEFAANTSAALLSDASVNDWATMINKKFIGVTAAARDDGTFVIKSNKGKTSAAQVSVIGGTLATKLFSADASSQGRSPEYKVNRLLGQIELSEPLSPGDQLKVGTINTRGFILSDATASFDLSATGSYEAELVFVADAPITTVAVAQTGTITFTNPSSGVTRIDGAVGQFSKVQDNDVAHLWATTPRQGIFRVIDVDPAGEWADLADPDPNTGSITLDGVTNRITFFRTEGLPQLVRFPDDSSTQSSQVVAEILAQTIGIDAELMDTAAVKVQTSRFLGEGALAIAAICGTAANLGFEAGNYHSNDPHVATIESADLSGIPNERLVVNAADNSDPFTSLSVQGTPFSFENHNRPVLTYLGANSKVLRQPLEKTSTSALTLRDELPSQSVGLGPDMRAAHMSGVELGQSDNMVFIIDNEPTRKTFDIPMYVEATVSGPSVPNSLQMDAEDSTGAKLGTSSRWLDYRFKDYRAWFQAKAEIPWSQANSAIKVLSTNFGPNGEKIKIGFTYPTGPDAVSEASYTVEPSTDEIVISINLASGAERSINLLPNQRLELENSGTTMKFKFIYPVDLSQVLVGDVVSLNDSQFASANRGQARVTAISNLIDAANGWEFIQESVTADITGNTSVQLSAPAAETIQVGDKLTIGGVDRLVTAVTDQDTFTIAAPGFTDGAGQSATLTHKAITASSLPAFTVAIGDLITVGSSTMKVTGVISTTEFNVDSPFSFTGLQTGYASRITLTATKYNPGASETFSTLSSQSLRVYEVAAGDNLASDLIDVINNTAGVKDLVIASNASGSDGSGSHVLSTQDELADTSKNVQLENGESFIYDVTNASPAIRLKEALPSSVEVGDKVRLIPMTPQNIVDHFAKKQISGLAIAADIELVDQGRKVQVSSKIPGGSGQVFAVGGRASGINVLAVRGNVQEINSNRAQIELDRSAIELLAPGHTIKISQPGRAKKRFPSTQPTALSTIDIQPSGDNALATLSVPFVLNYAYSQTGSPVWAVRNIGRGRVRFEVFSGTASVPAGVQVDDWVLVGNGDSYAGTTTDAVFAPANQGWFQIRETDNSTYFDVDGSAIEQFVTTTANSFIFTSYHSVRPGDQISIGFDSPVSTANKGTFEVLTVPSTTSVTYFNENIETEGPLALGSSGAESISVLDQGYTTYRKIVMVAPKPSDPTNKSIAVVSPGYDMGLVNEGQLAKITLPNRLGFGVDPVPGIPGYSYWTGLKRKVQRTIDGFEPDSSSFRGVAAAGVSVEAREALITRVAVSLKIKTSRGVSLQSISDTIRSAIDGYINSLGLGQDVILSEIVKLVQDIPGVEACVLTVPSPETERITIGDSSIAKISTDDITLS